MEEHEENSFPKKIGFASINLITENLTVLDLSNKNINLLNDSIILPVNLTELYLNHNELIEVPDKIINLKQIKILDLSFNKINYFDDTPMFYDTIEQLDISSNELLGPPYWIWAENCTNLVHLNLSCNKNLTKSFVNGYYEELLEYNTLVINITINNCGLIKHTELIGTFPKGKMLTIGNSELDNMCFTNKLNEVPCSGLDKCCDIEILDLSNTSIYHVNSNIDIYVNLKEINLSQNKLSGLPEEFCCLVNLEVCILSHNNLLYLPESFNKLEKIRSLIVDSNRLCMLPEHLCKFPQITILDLYNNNLYEVPGDIERLLEIDLAQNFVDEPDSEEYVLQKVKIRLNKLERYDGRKTEPTQPESEHSIDISDDELLFDSEIEEKDIENRPLSSPEDWESDEYWIPHNYSHSTEQQSMWLSFVKQKMKEGNFCPMDAHPISVADRVKYEKFCYPKPEYESDGQFDDYSSDES